MGACIVKGVIDTTGVVTNVRILRPENPTRELASALEADIKTFRFEPATLHGQPVAVYYSVSVGHCPARTAVEAPPNPSLQRTPPG
jgi:hypothetical protein